MLFSRCCRGLLGCEKLTEVLAGPGRAGMVLAAFATSAFQCPLCLLSLHAQAAKESGDSYDPRGTGAAWTHNFLNSEPAGCHS